MDMKNNIWSDDERYRQYSEYSEEYIADLKSRIADSKWRPEYHICPQSGLLNDPNGFSYYNGKWHLFYQVFPFGAVHGLKSWWHVISTDLVHWENKGLTLQPDTQYDRRGVYSGSAINSGDALFLYYTGNAADENGERLSSQMRAVMDSGGSIRKDTAPIITAPPEGYTMHFRDPQVFYHGNCYHMLLGAQRQSRKGVILRYTSDNLFDWKYEGELIFTEHEMGYMVECPNLVFVGSCPVLIFCPQGLDKSIADYHNIYPNMVLVGDEYSDNTFHSTETIQNLDEGFEFYAAQAINAPDGRTLVVGWIGLPDVRTPTENEGWAHCLSLVRELTLRDGVLFQYPVKETEGLRRQRQDYSFIGEGVIAPFRNRYELELTIPANTQGTIRLAANNSGEGGLVIAVDNTYGEITIDRSLVAGVNEMLCDTKRAVRFNSGINNQLNIFIDESVFEIFVDKGKKVLTGRFFPENDNKLISITCASVIQCSLWEI